MITAAISSNVQAFKHPDAPNVLTPVVPVKVTLPNGKAFKNLMPAFGICKERVLALFASNPGDFLPMDPVPPAEPSFA